MIDTLYTNISIFGTGCLLFGFGLCFLFVHIPESPALRNYRVARRVMACAYLFFGAVNVLEYGAHSADVHVPLTRMVTLVVACSQAFLFTYTLITLVNIRFVTRRRIIRELIPIALFIATAFVVYYACSTASFRLFFYVFLFFYLYLLIRFTRLFLANYRGYCFQMDNYFSEEESRRLRWVYFSFFAALAVGITALLSALFMSPLGSLLFSVALMGFYLYFSIGFISYATVFHHIEEAITIEKQPEEENVKTDPIAFAAIEEKVEEWVRDKQFTEQKVTIERLAAQLYTNRNYLSTYFNVHKKQTFRDWINKLRIEEAKALLHQHPDMTVSEIAFRVGFTDKSNFIRQFVKQTNVSPQVWRKESE
ncbi:MAG: AraC family transcriptional regulator [Candidatus Symbiothrix sp.]|jgi:AraC-like DNA-binding protein|nr:AraC family transcriptional regulator [Candidatus Symbiothrix sp.]